MIIRRYKLPSGTICKLHRIRADLIPNYFLLSFPKRSGEPSPAELPELLGFGITEARRLAALHVFDPESYTLVYSGYSARREKGWHIHIFLLGSRWKKAWLYGLLMLKNVAQALGIRKDDAPKQ